MKLIKTFLTYEECLTYIGDHKAENLQVFSDPLSDRWEIYNMDKRTKGEES